MIGYRLKYILKKSIFFILILVAYGCIPKQSQYHEYPISTVGIRNAILQDSFFLPKIQTIQDTTIMYAFDKCNAEGRMENFLIAGKVKEGKTKGKMPFDDTDLYKIIEGASYSLISKPNPELEAYLDSIIEIIKIGQEADGYLTTWFTIDRKSPPAPWVEPSEYRWENEISSHELYNSGHLFEAAAAHYQATGKRNFLNIALKNADLLVANFAPDQLHSPPGHQIVETGLIQLYEITKNNDYLELAKYFLDIRGDSLTHELYGEYNQDQLPVIEQTEAVGHAVRAEYMYAGMTDIAAIYQDTAYYKAIMNLWDNIVDKKMYITGGIGARHEGEAFGDNYELPNLTAYNETCAAIASVNWNLCMFLLSGDSKYYDIIERTLYNGLISGISLDGKMFFYPNPLESDGQYAFNTGSCTRQPWFDCSCCPTNLIRFLPSIPGFIYAVNQDSMYVNLYLSNVANIIFNENKVDIKQQTEYPWNGKIDISVNPQKNMIFTLKLRIPGWAMDRAVPGDLYSYLEKHEGKILLKINGKEEQFFVNKGYAEISKEWAKGDKVELLLPMIIHQVVANAKVQDDKNKVAFEYGPFVYCAEEIDNSLSLNFSIPENLSLTIGRKNILNEKVTVIKGNINDEKITLIPYYLWSNRGVGKMQVWFPIDN